MSRILAVDLDGTLFYPKQIRHFLPKKNLLFVRKFIDAGNRLVLISSRSAKFIERVIKEIDRPVDYIAYLGCVISIDGKIVKDQRIPKDIAYKVIEESKKTYIPFGFANSTVDYPVLLASGRDKESKFKNSLYKFWYKAVFGYYAEDLTYSKDAFYNEINEGNLYSIKIFFGISKKKNKINKELNKEIREKYSDVEASWLGLANEITPKGCSKSESLEFYLNYLKRHSSDLSVIGDSGNDITMFNKFYENSYVMAHAYPSVKKYAKHVVSRVHKLEKYLLEEEKK